MTRHSRILILVVLLAMLAMLATAAVAQHRGHRPGHGASRGHGGDAAPFARMLDRLDLSDEQREQVRQRIAERRQANQGLMQQMRERRQALTDAIHAEQFDDLAIRAAAASVAELEADIAVERALGLRDVLDVLTAEQRDEARTMIQRHRERLESGEAGFRGHRRHHAPGERGQGRQELGD